MEIKFKYQELNTVFTEMPGIFNQFSLKMMALTIFISIQFEALELHAQRISRDLNVDLFINQGGYMPYASKSCVTKGEIGRTFEVIDLETQKVVYTGSFLPYSCDFGEYSVGDFSALTREGYYYIKSDTLRSYPFQISKAIYQSPKDLIVGYFSLQRCGSSTTGFLSPCHLDDGKRLDNGKHQDVTGGWHDATDLRRGLSNTIYGMIGLAKAYELMDENNKTREKILDELMWGNQYFLKMQEPEGYVMAGVGTGFSNHPLAEGRRLCDNRWTDNEIGPEGGELRVVIPTAGETDFAMLVFGDSDDRIIHTNPADMFAQYNFITSQAIMSRFTRVSDKNYSQKCLDAAIRCFNWSTSAGRELNAGQVGASIQASIEMYKTTGQDKYKNFAIAQALELKKLQVNTGGSVSGFFHTSSSDPEPYKESWFGRLELISICDLIKAFPMHKDVPIWKKMISDYTSSYVLSMSQKNSFGIMPYGLYSGQDPGGNRKVGDYWYRYFMQPELSWWSGINANIASFGVGLVKASVILNKPELMVVAQKQLDWIIGANPFNSSTLIGVGYNHLDHYVNQRAFRPATPVLPGAVMNGLGGDKMDQPFIGNGIWQVSEYWTPMVAYTLWLMAEISQKE